MKPIVSVLVCLSMIVLMAAPIMSQEGRARNADSLRERIQLLETADIKSQSPVVQSIYKRSLLRLYNNYSSSLAQEITELNKILSAVGDADATSKNEVASQIRKLTNEHSLINEKIQTLAGDLRADISTAESSTPNTPNPVAESPALSRSEQGTYRRADSFTPVSHVVAASEGATARAESNFQTRQTQTRPLLNTTSLAALAALQVNNAPATTPSENVVQVDWPTRTAGCPASVSQSSTRAAVRVTNVNDLLIDFNTGAKVEYQLRAKGTPVSAVPAGVGIFTGQSGAIANNACSLTPNDVRNLLARIRDQVNANPFISPQQPGGSSISLATTLAAALNIPEVAQVLNALGRSECAAVFDNFANDPVLNWVRRLQGAHSYDFSVILEPNRNYEFTLTEFWRGAQTNGGTIRWDCGESDIFTLSVGPLVSMLGARTYNHQKAPVPPGGTTTQDILTVGNKSNINVLGAALINYHFPKTRFLPARAGMALSVGPVYNLGSTPNVSPLGLFAGMSFNLSRSVFLTPGVHIGQFADFPEGFYPGSVIPNQFGDLNPVKRMTAKFAIGITFKTNSFKKTTEAGGTAKSATTGGTGATQPTSGSQSTSGSQGSTPNN